MTAPRRLRHSLVHTPAQTRAVYRDRALRNVPYAFLPVSARELPYGFDPPLGCTIYYALRATGRYAPTHWVKRGPITAVSPDNFWTADLGDIPIYRDVIACAFID